jgi:non-canonical purine NTP pyrophosphatase (RdgB/HAM1 family)
VKKRYSIVLATRNQHKIDEIKDILDLDIEYHSLSDYIAISVQEAGRTLKENSLAKAAFTYKITQKPSLADDSGLFVDALNNAPGVFSARYGTNDVERIERLLSEMKGIIKRSARFKAVYVYYFRDKEYAIFEGSCPGEISDEPRGTQGFGYDPIFIPRGYSKTFAELGTATKNRISHRAKALEKFKAYITSRLS